MLTDSVQDTATADRQYVGQTALPPNVGRATASQPLLKFTELSQQTDNTQTTAQTVHAQPLGCAVTLADSVRDTATADMQCVGQTALPQNTGGATVSQPLLHFTELSHQTDSTQTASQTVHAQPSGRAVALAGSVQGTDTADRQYVGQTALPQNTGGATVSQPLHLTVRSQQTDSTQTAAQTAHAQPLGCAVALTGSI